LAQRFWRQLRTCLPAVRLCSLSLVDATMYGRTVQMGMACNSSFSKGSHIVQDPMSSIASKQFDVFGSYSTSFAPDVPHADSGIVPDSETDLAIAVGTSRMMKEDHTLVSRISRFSSKSEGEVMLRLSYGDAGSDHTNRVMHIAFLNGVAVGWCSSSTSSWGGGGHWGALAVDPQAQSMGVASALVHAAEKRLLDAGCQSIQIEYRFTVGDPAKERLYAWYEGKLGFDGGPKRSGFRCCHKRLSAESFREQHAKRRLCAKEASADQGQSETSRTRASSPSTCTSSSPSDSPT